MEKPERLQLLLAAKELPVLYVELCFRRRRPLNGDRGGMWRGDANDSRGVKRDGNATDNRGEKLGVKVDIRARRCGVGDNEASDLSSTPAGGPTADDVALLSSLRLTCDPPAGAPTSPMLALSTLTTSMRALADGGVRCFGSRFCTNAGTRG